MYGSTVAAALLLVVGAQKNTNEVKSLATDLNWAGMICTTTSTSVDPNNACVFPFKYKGRTFNGCTTNDDLLGRAWCATSRDRDGQLEKGKWGYCSRPNSKACISTPNSATDHGKKDKSIHKNDPRSAPRSAPRSDPRSDLRNDVDSDHPRNDPRSDVRSDHPRSDSRRKQRASPTVRPPAHPSAISINRGVLIPAPIPTSCPTIGGPSGPGQSCVFPFVFAGVRYEGCTTDNDPEGKAWCVTEVDRDGQYLNGSGNWGYCTGNTKYHDACSGHSNGNSSSSDEKEGYDSKKSRNSGSSHGDSESHHDPPKPASPKPASRKPASNNTPSPNGCSHNKFGWSADAVRNHKQAIRLFSAFPGLFRPALPALVETGSNSNGKITLLDLNADDSTEMAEWKALLQSANSPETLASVLAGTNSRIINPESVASAFPLPTNNAHLHDEAGGISLSGRFVVVLKDVDHYLQHPLETNPTVVGSPQLSLFAKRMKFQQTAQRLRALTQSFAAQRFVRESEYRATRVAQVAINITQLQQQQQQLQEEEEEDPEWRLRFWGDILTTLVRANLLICNLSPEAARWMAKRPEVDAIVPGRHVEALGALVVRLVSKAVEEKEGNYEIERWTYAGNADPGANGENDHDGVNDGSGDDDWWADDVHEHEHGHNEGKYSHDQSGLMMDMRVHSRRRLRGSR